MTKPAKKIRGQEVTTEKTKYVVKCPYCLKAFSGFYTDDIRRHFDGHAKICSRNPDNKSCDTCRHQLLDFFYSNCAIVKDVLGDGVEIYGAKKCLKWELRIENKGDIA